FPPQLIARALDTLREAQKAMPQAIPNDVAARVDDAFKQALNVAKVENERQAAVAKVQELGDNPRAENIKKIRELIAEQNRKQPGFDQEGEVQAALTKLYQGPFTNARYVPGGDVPAGPRRAEDTAPSM